LFARRPIINTGDLANPSNFGNHTAPLSSPSHELIRHPQLWIKLNVTA
jgi:hypothetical protein